MGETTASGDRELRVGVWVKPQHQGTENSGWEFGGNHSIRGQRTQGGSLGETTASGDRDSGWEFGWGDRELRVGVWVNHSIRGQRTQGGSLGETTASGDRELRVGVWEFG